MSALLESALTDAQREACARNDAALDEAERQRVQADLDYLAKREQQARQRLAETAELEQGYHSRLGWLV